MNKKGNLALGVIILLVAIIAFSGFKFTGHSVLGETYLNDKVPYKLAELFVLNLEDVDNYEKYKTFADNVNSAIRITNEQLEIQIPALETSQEAWNKSSKFITKYGPLIKTYNSVVLSSKSFVESPSNEKYQKVYKELGVFSLEFTFISATIFHTAVFNAVGAFYTSSGMTTFALKCPSCVSEILSAAYWSIKAALVESASKGADFLFNQLQNITKEDKGYA